LKDETGNIWVFWRSNRTGNYDLWYNRYSDSTGWVGDTQLSTDASSDYEPTALLDSVGDIWVFWYSARNGRAHIMYNRYNTASSTWGGEVQLTTGDTDNYQPEVSMDRNGDIWVLWNRIKYEEEGEEEEYYNIYYKKIVPTI
jgi:hypothetical protein